MRSKAIRATPRRRRSTSRLAIDRFEQVVDWPVEAVERSWAGLRSFAPDRMPVYGFDPASPSFFWCVGQGGFGIQTAPAASRLAASLLLRRSEPELVSHRIDAQVYSPAAFRAINSSVRCNDLRFTAKRTADAVRRLEPWLCGSGPLSLLLAEGCRGHSGT